MRFRVGVLALAGLSGSVFWAQETTRSVWDGVYTQEQADRGKIQYDKVCAACHGDELQGNDTTPTLTGDPFLYNWYGYSIYEMYNRIHRDMPANEDKGSVTRAESSELMAYILSFNGFPAGKMPLSTQDEVLKTIRIEAKK